MRPPSEWTERVSHAAAALALFVIGTAAGTAAAETGSPTLFIGYALALAAGFVALGAHGIVFTGAFDWRAHDSAASLKALLLAAAEPYSGLRAALGVLTLVGALTLLGGQWPGWVVPPVLVLLWLVVGLPLNGGAQNGPAGAAGAAGQPG
ncbi:hypothetical protein NE857_20070 [Nocardiopsis exhalans]|uniref:Uncharacterized protein n=1 Tax=Nocardiopsis exhalans TaxID=163604 RepID=A0ABY5D1M6_9ACTN|nr:hypothetical protein [Nocardiopsis exhalans]USY17631.1 hypothetical protein NE857_20070 [Nocardiopsis exhalans]